MSKRAKFFVYDKMKQFQNSAVKLTGQDYEATNDVDLRQTKLNRVGVTSVYYYALLSTYLSAYISLLN